MQTLSIQLPDELLASGVETDIEVLARHTEALAREALMVKLYDLGRISSGRAAHMLGISRPAFLHMLGRYGVSESDENIDLAEEVRISEAARRAQ